MQESTSVGKIPWRRPRSPLQCSCLENPMGRGAWWVAVHGVSKSRTRLKRLSTHTRSLHKALFGAFVSSLCLPTWLREELHNFLKSCWYRIYSRAAQLMVKFLPEFNMKENCVSEQTNLPAPYCGKRSARPD